MSENRQQTGKNGSAKSPGTTATNTAATDTTAPKSPKAKIKHFIDVKQTVQQASPQEKDKSQPLRACGCAFKYLPAQNRAITYRHKAASKSDDKLSRPFLKIRERSKSCTPLPASNEKYTLTSKKKENKSENTIVRFQSQNVLNADNITASKEPSDDKLILVPEVYGEHRFQTTFWWEPRAVPDKYSTSVYIDINNSAKYYVEEVSMKVRLVPCPYVESLGTLHRYKSTVEANVESSTVIETTFHLTGKIDNETII